ncbi:hypothetical protein BS78_06G054200 [Paspalum vaginatum]|nr:hypothetical protein BS78_06G054200 [Paspalum vaginatum]
MEYTSPMEALSFLKDHEKDVDFALVAVNMQEMHSFQFLDVSREFHKNLQVIMMLTDTTWSTMKRSIELGARFLVKKPLDTNTANNIWQHLDIQLSRMENIKDLFQGIKGKTNDVSCLYNEELESSANNCGQGNRQKATAHLMWTPFLHSKFVDALELLGEAATPKKIQLIMNVKSIDRKQISAHLQKHRKKIERELHNTNEKKFSTGESSSQAWKTFEISANTCQQYCPDIQSDEKANEKPNDRTQSFTKARQTGKKVCEAIRRALQLGAVFDESQLSNDSPGEEGNKGEAYVMTDDDAKVDSTFALGDTNVITEPQHIQDATDVTSVHQATVVKLVAYSDAEDDDA